MGCICSKSQYAKNQNGKALKIPQLTISLKLKAENFKYALSGLCELSIAIVYLVYMNNVISPQNTILGIFN